MSDSYQLFRTQQLAELRETMPQATYRQKLKIISDRWKRDKEAQKIILSPREVMQLLDDPPSDHRARQLTYTLENSVTSEWMVDGRLLDVLKGLLTKGYSDKVCIQVLHLFLHEDSLFNLTGTDGLTLLDLSIVFQRPDLLFYILTKAPSSWVEEKVFQSQDQSMLSCLFHVLCQHLGTVEIREPLINWIRKAIGRGVDPNLELSHPTCPLTIEEWYYGDKVYDYIRFNLIPLEDVQHFVRYVGTIDRGRSFRHRTGVVDYKQPSEHLVGETLFSVLYRNAVDCKSRSLCRKLICSPSLQWQTIYFHHELARSECYLTMMMRSKLRNVIEDAFMGYFRTPTYMFYIAAADYPLSKLFDRIGTRWEGYLLTLPGVLPVIRDIFRRDLVRPSTVLLQKFIMNPPLVTEILNFWEIRNQEDWKTRPNFLETSLAKLLLTPPCLERVLRNPRWAGELTREFLNQAGESFRGEFILPECAAGTTPPTNEWFVDGTDVQQYIDHFPLFISDDGFAFSDVDLHYLLEKQSNPFNRRPFTSGEIHRIHSLHSLYENWWFLIGQPIPTADYRKSTELSVTVLTERIDEFLMNSPFFVYGERLTNLVGKLDSREKIQATYLCLLSSPAVLVPDMNDLFSHSCIPFQSRHDHFLVEQANIHYGIKVSQSVGDTETVQSALIDFLCWVLAVLECTAASENVEKLNGRIFSLYIILVHFVKRL